jgi:hypothetical protein
MASAFAGPMPRTPLPFNRVCLDEGCEAAEVRQQRLGVHHRYPWNTRESGLGGWKPCLPLRSLCVGRYVAKPIPGAALSEALEPKHGIPCVDRANYVYAQVHECHADSTNCGSRERSIIEVSTFDEHVREACSLADSPELGPERSLNHVCVKSTHRLSFDDRAFPHFIVPRGQVSDLDGYTDLSKEMGDPTRLLVNVCNDSGTHRRTLAHRASPIQRRRVPLQEQLGLSRSESP